jgi:septal ring factor EnvC (AmiA/AmiB activator)
MRGRILLLSLLLVTTAAPLRAEDANTPDTSAAAPASAPDTTASPDSSASADTSASPDATAEEAARRAELDAVTHDIALTSERQAELKGEIEALDKDRATLNQSLIEANQQVQKLEGTIDEAEGRLKALYAKEGDLRASLASRRDALAEVLAALQRMGRRPPPAILVRPEDALTSIRSAILLGAIVPDLREQATALAKDLADLVAVREAREKELDGLRTNAAALAEGRARIALLMDERQKQRQASSDALADEEKRSATLAGQATSLRDLIARMEAESATAAAAAAQAKQAAAEAEAAPGTAPPRSLGSADRLTPKVAFGDAKGLLPLPVAGTETTAFGADDGLGGKTQGISLATRDGAVVSSPSDGWVVYAGPFRSYGQLLIINAGGGYHVLLAGMERIDVQLGQFVLAGEPVAVMPSRKLASTETAIAGTAQPALYIEFRKDGASIDPAPWWAASNAEKAGG